jgi:riboflavin kinase/FMN adenylyltransferase
MQVHFGISALCAEWPAAVACIGTFDGVHLGHRRVISSAVQQALEADLPCVLITFDRHPAAVLHPERVPPAISTLEESLSIYSELGVSVALVLAFDEALCQTSATDFLDVILKGATKATSLVIGHDFALGKDRQGTPEWLSDRIPTTVLPPFELGGIRVSSSAIRAHVLEGKVQEATQLLGRPFAVSGVVVSGQKLGRELGFPTANIVRSSNLAVPANGIYAGRFLGPSGTYSAAISIGYRPAVGGTHRTLEAYLLDYPGGSLYGQACKVEFLQRLREERDFDSLEGLIEQMRVDVEFVRRLEESIVKR